MNKSCLIVALISILLISTSCEENTISDFEGNEYEIKNFASDTWMLENLKSKFDKTGKPINVYYPNKNPDLMDAYGLLYNYETACEVCPSGWHLPNNEEWMRLIAYMKNIQSAGWKNLEYWGNNEADENFLGLPSGYGNTEFESQFGMKATFWSETKDGDEFAWAFLLEDTSDTIRYASQHPHYGFSVRCVKNSKSEK